MKTNNPKEEEEEEEEREKVENVLSERLEAHDESRRAAQDKLEEICRGLEASIDGFENSASSELEEKSAAESNRLQSALADLQVGNNSSGGGGGGVVKAVQRAKTELLAMQSYDVTERGAKMKGGRLNFDVSTLYELKTATVFVPEVLGMLKPTGVRAFRNGKRDGLSSVHVP